MRKAPSVIISALLVFSMLFVFIFMSGDEDDINNAIGKFIATEQLNTQTTFSQERIQVPKKDNDTLLGNVESSDGSPKLPGLSTSIPVPDDLAAFIMMPFEEAWQVLIGTDDPEWSYDKLRVFNDDTEAKLHTLKDQRAVTITVPIWTWASDDPNDLSKTPSTMNITCNVAMEKMFTTVFNEIYNSPDMPVFTPGTCGGYSIRDMASGSGKTSGHSFGCTVDLNWDVMLDGKGNKMSSSKPTPSYDEWKQLPECQDKYEIFYEGCTVVNTFKAYGFQWGGDWNSYTDGMHFSFIGDNGTQAREIGQENYRNYGGK